MLTYLAIALSKLTLFCTKFWNTKNPKSIEKEPHYSLRDIQESVTTYLQLVRDFAEGYSFTSLPCEYNSKNKFSYHNQKLKQFLLASKVFGTEINQSLIDQAVVDLTSSVQAIKAGRDQLLFAALFMGNENEYYRKFL